MNVEVKLYKKEGKYKDKNGNDKRFVNFYISAKDKLIPIEIKYFPQDKFDGRDPSYQGRLSVVEMLADTLPEKEESKASVES